ncbi:unnamed protein product [Brassica rapa]|uniref:Uncharacterized protein n=1 Tax=Brassica campestris TaxID=3711 RepID=A0A8D9CVB6_BRACM|nr:unnamed protein product [Brassica rapa]
MLSPRTSVLICVLMDSHGRHVYVLCVLTDSHRQPRTSCVCWRTPTDTHEHTRTAMDVLCVLTNSHRQPQTSCVCWRTPTDVLPRGPKSPKQSTGRASMLSPRTNVLICVLMDSHRRPVHGRPVCAGGRPRTSCVY